MSDPLNATEPEILRWYTDARVAAEARDAGPVTVAHTGEEWQVTVGVKEARVGIYLRSCSRSLGHALRGIAHDLRGGRGVP